MRTSPLEKRGGINTASRLDSAARSFKNKSYNIQAVLTKNKKGVLLQQLVGQIS
jgi:hypothetical protein